jgi:cold shock CspA family protein
LERAFDANRRNAFVGIRLARIHEGQGDLAKATSVLKAALDAKPGDKGLHFRYAMLLNRKGQGDLDTLLYHFRRGFTQWDTNYDAQFWFARYAFEAKDEETRSLGKEVFKQLRNTPLKHDLRVQIRSYLEEGGARRTFTGSIVRRQETNGFLEMDGRGEWIFFHRNDQSTDVWEGLREGERVTFQVGFSFGGALAVNMERS